MVTKHSLTVGLTFYQDTYVSITSDLTPKLRPNLFSKNLGLIELNSMPNDEVGVLEKIEMHLKFLKWIIRPS